MATALLLLEYVMAPVPEPPEAVLVKVASPTILSMGPAVAKVMVCATGGGGDVEPPPPPPPPLQALKHKKPVASSSGPRNASRIILVFPFAW